MEQSGCTDQAFDILSKCRAYILYMFPVRAAGLENLTDSSSPFHNADFC